MKNYSLLFDLDGTIVDTAPDLLNTLNRVLIRAGCAPLSMQEDFRHLVSFGAKRMIEVGFERSGQPVDSERLNTLTELFLEDYIENFAVDSAPFPGVISGLQKFKSFGASLGVCTNKREDLSVKLLGELEMIDYFGFVAGSNTFQVRKPDPGHITETIAKLGGDVSRSVMIGDSQNDILAARAAKIPVIAVTYGYCEIPLHQLEPDAIVDHFDELEAAISRLL